MKVSRSLAGALQAVAGLALVVLAVVGAITYFGNSINFNGFAALAFVLTLVVLVMTYFGLYRWRTAGTFLATVGVLVGGVLWLNAFKQPDLNTNQFQAVFLTNGQVYFGHLKNASSQNPVLTDIYYLQSQAAQPNTNGKTTTAQTAQTQLSLVKLGNELHGPEDQMAIKADQILFWENLKNNSKVVTAIKQNQAKK